MQMNLTNNQQVRQFSSLEILAREVVEGFITGMHKSPFHGFSVEFAEHRLYNTGESTRHIDWKLYGKTEKLFVKRYEEETNLRCQLVIDRSSSMYFPQDSENNKITFSIQAAAALTHLLRTQRDAIGLTVFNNAVETYLPAKLNNQHLYYMYSQLEQLQQQEKPLQQTRVVEALHEVAERTHQRSLVVIFSDLFSNDDNLEDLFAALQHLRYNKHEVIVFHTVKRNQEVELDYENRPYKFVDLETGVEVKVNPKQIQESYQQQLTAREHEIKIRCGQYKIDFVEADIDKGFDTVLLAYLLKRNKMLKR